MEVSGQLHVPVALPPGKRPCYPLDRRLSGPQSRSGHDGEEKNSQPPPGLEPPIIQPVAQRYTTTIMHLSLSSSSSSSSLYHRLPFPWYFSSKTSGALHQSGFIFHIIALSLLCVPSTAVFFSVENLLNALLALFPHIS
jgi:hypothetical protein